jgi:chromosome partitioning protein
MQQHIVDVFNLILVMMRKGGAGKTSLTLMLADALARLGLNILVVDLDPQGNSSYGFGKEVILVPDGQPGFGGRQKYVPKDYTVCEVIDSGAPGIADYAISMVTEGYWNYDTSLPFDRGGPLFPGKVGAVGVIPCYKALEGMVPELKTLAQLERLRNALILPGDGQPVPPHHRWDAVLFDTPPGGSQIHVLAAMAAYKSILVTSPAKFGALAVPETMELVSEISANYHHGLEVLGLIFNDFTDRRTNQKLIVDDLETAYAAARDNPQADQRFRVPLWPVRIPHLDVVKDSQDAQAPISALLGISKSRPAARRICQAAEANAIRLLEAIGHPHARTVRSAWAEAWPAKDRADFMNTADFINFIETGA